MTCYFFFSLLFDIHGLHNMHSCSNNVITAPLLTINDDQFLENAFAMHPFIASSGRKDTFWIKRPALSMLRFGIESWFDGSRFSRRLSKAVWCEQRVLYLNENSKRRIKPLNIFQLQNKLTLLLQPSCRKQVFYWLFRSVMKRKAESFEHGCSRRSTFSVPCSICRRVDGLWALVIVYVSSRDYFLDGRIPRRPCRCGKYS